MGAHDEFDDFFGDDDSDAPVVDTRADGRLLRIPLARLSPNKVNPRTDFGTKDELIDLGKSLGRQQNQPCPVVSRAAYLKLWEDHAGHVGDVDYVLVSGERRYRGGTAAGLSALDCVVNDNFAKDRRTFMEAVVSENVDRSNFDAVEEAYAVQALVREFGSNRAVAQHFERADGWVTQRVMLTYLAPATQDLVRRKEMPLEVARSLGKQVRDEHWTEQQQAAWWRDEKEGRKKAAQAKKEAKAARKRSAPRSEAPPTTVSSESPGSGQPQPEAAPRFTAVKRGDSGTTAEPEAEASTLATQESSPPGERQQEPQVPQQAAPQQRPSSHETAESTNAIDHMPWHDPAAVRELIMEWMDPGPRGQLVKMLLADMDEQTA